MIRSLAMALLLGGAGAAWASEQESSSESDETEASDPLSPYRTQFDELAQRTIGTTSMPVAFSWRRTRFHVAPFASFLHELNSFDSMRTGALVRLPSSGAIVELGAAWAWTWDTPSTRMLALTPYRQPARPSRLELDLGLAYPLAEGVVTAVPRFFPSVQLVFNAYASLRYMVYPGSKQEMTTREVLSSVFSPTLTDQELENLEDRRLDAMQLDPGRYGLMLGLGNDLYFEQGFFVSPRVMVAVPILSWASGTELRMWADYSVAVGMSW